MKMRVRICVTALMWPALVLLNSCGGSSYSGTPSPQPTPAADFSVGGTVSGLAGANSAITLKDNGGDAMTVKSNGAFVFPKKIQGGDTYDVTIASEPTNPPQNCMASGAKGTVVGDVTSVTVTCAAPAQYTVSGTIENLTGSNSGLLLALNGQSTFTARGSGTFMFIATVEAGQQYDVSIAQQPTNPRQSCSITNASGEARVNVTNVVVDCGHKEWAWMSGSTATGQEGVYGTMGIAAPGSNPGARQNPVTWTDAEGNLWLFAGYGFDSIGTLEPMNDLWKYSNGEWAWMGGPNLAGRSGVYGTMGVAAPGNIPGARTEESFWKDGNGDVWVFGGNGFDSVGTEADLNDLWRFSNGEWTWMGGSNTARVRGTYGTEGMPAPGNVPGARAFAMNWVDASGNLWLFGGIGFDASGTQGSLNDLWEYSNGEWTWISGSSAANQNGVYGTQGVASVGNVPGGRSAGLGWADDSGDFWVFAGAGFPASGSSIVLSDLWKYSNGEWTWEAGSNSASDRPNYGTQGVASLSNTPGAFEMGSGVTDANGNFWMFGGNVFVTNSTAGDVDNLWEFSNGQWTWVTGTAAGATTGVYGTKGFFSPSNLVGGRINEAMWIDASGNFWVFGGWGFGTAATEGDLSDLWEYKF